jgi:hypothetical protein
MSTQEQTQGVTTEATTWTVMSKYSGRHYWVFPSKGLQGIRKWSHFFQYPATQKGLARATRACQRYCDRLNDGRQVPRNVFDRVTGRDL